ncbi:hypothetical protein BABINDRAFT_170024 [Babjeviella inositovora NRRL Y-12698]|uniref:allantoicase n=1 Tax=Babjeviella inositovora NRRL Y-12698 TaxID=984486 RepID=A0A1E3QZ08_9ASCO|nr:uncharacterized protein BABINDRAFT_170024 [Babjeviella inositovora NRRL Y-12698]ODQ82903.1 hypothetical protein BABINDRAFT_170024 [Babjeviella inositovora NRRL Y-12698]
MSGFKSITEQEFQEQIVAKYTDVIGEKIGGKVLGFSDEFFAEAGNLIKPKPPIRDATKFVHSGAWFDGWETRRHNTEEADWVVFKTGVSSAKLIGVEVDTTFFDGNHAPAISVEAASLTGDSYEKASWEPVIPFVECGPSQKFFFVRDTITAANYTHVRLRMYPDGGIARFRAYGKVVPILPKNASTIVDTASVNMGGVAVARSDAHFGSADNLILPGRGHDMSDGWETYRSRSEGHVDWALIKLGGLTKIDNVVIDTANFRGNFPQKINVKAIKSDQDHPDLNNPAWVEVVGNQKTGPHAEHTYKVNSTETFSHVLLTIIPDGGVKRIRVNGVLVQN